MTELEKNTIVRKLTKKIRKDGFIKLSSLKAVFLQEGINMELYPSSGLKKWISDNFPEFLIMGKNGHETLRMADDMTAKAWLIIESELMRNGKILMSAVPGILSNHPAGINYKILAKGQRLGEWIQSVFPDFKISGDNMWLSHTIEPAVTPVLPVSEPVSDTEDRDDRSHTETSLIEIQQMHVIAYMNWWNLNIKKIRAYNEEVTEESAKRSIAHQIARILLGTNGIFIDGMDEDTPRVAFETGLKKADSNDSIYCVLTPNPRYENGQKQKFVQSGFCCLGDGTELGDWIKEHSKSTGSREAFSVLEGKAALVNEQLETMTGIVEKYLKCLMSGKLPNEEISGKVADFESACSELRSIYFEAWNAPYPDDHTVFQVKELANEKNAISRQTVKALRGLCVIIEKTHELFSMYSLVNDTNSTPMRDKAIIETVCSAAMDHTDFGQLLSILCFYKDLRDVMAAKKIDSDGIVEKIDNISSHFSELSFKIAAKILVDSDPGELAYFSDLEAIEDQIRACENAYTKPEKDTGTAREGVSPEHLLERIHTLGKDIAAIHGLTAALCGNNEIVQMLIFSELTPLENYFENHRNNPLYTDAGMEHLKNRDLPEELTFWAAAERLYRVIGNFERIAERYYILGLLFEEEKNFHSLLKLYSREKNDDLYLKIFNTYSNDNSLDTEEQISYLEILCKCDPGAALAYSREHCYLLYQPRSMELLLSLPSGILGAEEKQRLLMRKELFEAAENRNELEDAVCHNNTDLIQTILSRDKELTEMGYSEDEILRIRKAAFSVNDESLNTGNVSYDTGSRFYRYQKNKNSLAEYYMWKGIAENKNILANGLMVILAENDRWDECCKLYECFRMLYSESASCRMLYLLARIKSDPFSASDYIRTNLQECLSFMISNSQTFIRRAVVSLCSHDNNEISAFYDQIRKLCSFLDDPLIKSIVCLDRSLREYSDSAVLKKLGVSDKFAAAITGIYKADSYPHGTDAYSIGYRVFIMIGTYKGAAENFAKFALPDMKTVRLLWDIYNELEDEIALLSLMQEYPVLREENEERYLSLLFQKEYYLEFVSECAMKADSWKRTMQLFIAELKVVPDQARIPLPDIGNADDKEEESLWYKTWGALLISTLYECRRLEDIKTILFQMFTEWTKSFEPELIRKIVTGNETVDEERLSVIQRQALETRHTELSLYIYNVLKIGEKNELVSGHIENEMRRLDSLSLTDHLNGLRRLRVIYGDSIKSLEGEIALLEIIQVSEEMPSDAERKAERIGKILESFPEDEDLLLRLLHNINDAVICTKPQIYNNLIKLAVTDELKTQLVRFFDSLNSNDDILADIEMQRSVYSLYADTMMKGVFPEEIIARVEDSCTVHARLYRTVESLLCLYFIKIRDHNTDCAEYILRVLAEHPLDNMDESIGKTINALLSRTWGYDIPGYFDLFKKVLNNLSIDEITAYLEFVYRISQNMPMTEIEVSVNETSTRVLSEDDSNELIKHLYCNIYDLGIWEKSISLPIQDNPAAYAKLLYMNSTFNPGYCELCASYCEKYEQNELLINVLLIWANVRDEQKAEECRKYIENRLYDDPDYLLRWKDDPRILDLIKAICIKYKGYEQEIHALLRATSLIAEKSGSPDALKYFLEAYRSEIFGQNCNLGVVLVANLILDKRFREAHEILCQLKNVLSLMNYKELVDLLAEKNAEELEEWAGNIENSMMLQLTMPDGNTPSLEKLNEITDLGIVNGQAGETINVIKRILSMFENDYGAYNALYNLCCTDPINFIPDLHTCLRGLIRLHPSKNASSFYRRKQLDYAEMLAVLDALCIVNQWTNRITDYDFSKSTGEYYMTHALSDNKTYQKRAAISEKRTETEASFRNRNEKQVRMLTRAYLSAISGNWKELIEDAWKEKEDISFEINVSAGTPANNVGLIRSLLRVLLEIREEERDDFLSWIQQMAANGSKERYPEKYRETEFVTDFYKEGYFSVLESQTEFEPLAAMLTHPFEDYSLSGKWEKLYIDSALKKKTDTSFLFATVWMISALVKHPYFQAQLLKKADAYFEKGNDAYAWVFYKALHKISRGLYLQHEIFDGTDYKKTSNTTFKIRCREYYEARYRITALFSNDSYVINRVKNSGFHIWSCMNMVLSLLYSPRSDEIRRLSMFFGKRNRQLAEDLLTAFDPSVRDDKKLELIENRTDEVEKAYFCYVVKYPFNPKNKSGEILISYALTDPDVKQQFNGEYIQSVKALANNPAISGSRPSKLLLVESRKPDGKAFEQKDPSLWNMSAKTIIKEKIMTEEEIPFFAKDITPAFSDRDIQQVIEEHKKLQNLAGNMPDKLELSRMIYQHYLSDNQPREVLDDALLMFGNDYYYSALAEGKKDVVSRVLLEMTRILKYRNPKGEGTETAKRTVQEGLLILIKSSEDLQSLLSYYGEHKTLLQYIRGLITDGLVGACVAQVFGVLDSLRNCYASVSQDNQEILREELSLNYRQLEEIETNRWMEMKNRVQKLINDEINELDQRPVLQFEILNSGSQQHYGNLFGEVHNIGKIAAENIVIQAAYSDNSSSNQYILKRLSPEGKAVFELDYSCDKKTDKIDYLVTVSFGYSERMHSSTVCKGTLILEDIKKPDYPTGLLTQYADGIMFKVDEATGEVYSPEFVGRKNETAMLRNLVAGDSFEDYKSALMYGIRRTGKTSLLNYLEAFIGLKRDNIICVKTDCQSIPAKDPIQYVFIDRVLDIVERKIPGIKTENAWSELKQNWSSGYFCADQQPEKLSLFYMDVKELIRDKGLFLIIDEIDRLFERVEQTQMKYHRNLDSLFGAVSEILNSYSCRKAVHLVICGSNWLIRYNLKGDRKNQLFQRFGKQVIEVGKLPENDAREVIFLPYRPYPELIITEEAVKWIWDYAGGLVWHTKLLGEEAIERAKKDNRYVVYPSDIRQSMPKVITELWCKQFYEGCEDGEERRFVDAMQSLAAKKDAYVHINQLSDLMGTARVEIQRIITVLLGLKIITAHPIDSQMFRFELDIYRRYFRTNPSIYEQVMEEPDIFQIKQSEKNKNEPFAVINNLQNKELQESDPDLNGSLSDDDSEWYDE